MKYSKKGFEFDDFVITKREIIVSFAILAVLCVIGFFCSNIIAESEVRQNEIYNKAVKIENPDVFQHGMDTNIGNAFVYGDLEAVDIVSYPELPGEYMYVKKNKEKYTRHTRTVKTTENGKTKTKTEVYYTWDVIDREDKRSKEIKFCGVVFPIEKIDIPNTRYIDTIKESSDIRYVYYGTGIKHTGTIFTELKDGTIPDDTKFYEDRNIDETIVKFKSQGGDFIFWLVWVFVIIGLIFWFVYKDNDWLEK